MYYINKLPKLQYCISYTKGNILIPMSILGIKLDQQPKLLNQGNYITKKSTELDKKNIIKLMRYKGQLIFN